MIALGQVQMHAVLDIGSNAPPEWQSEFYWLCRPCGGRPSPDDYESIKDAADALRDHLRTEHADLFEACKNCGASGRACLGGLDYTRCPCCHSRGWTYTNGDDR